MSGFPTLILFDDGRPVGQHVGMADMSMLLRYAGVRAAAAPSGDAAREPQAAPAVQTVAMDVILSGEAPSCAQGLRALLTACRSAACAERAQAGLQDELGALRRELAALPGDAGAAAQRHVDTIAAIVSASSTLR